MATTWGSSHIDVKLEGLALWWGDLPTGRGEGAFGEGGSEGVFFWRRVPFPLAEVVGFGRRGVGEEPLGRAAGEGVSARDGGLDVCFGGVGSERGELDFGSGVGGSSGVGDVGLGVEGETGTVVFAAPVFRALPLTTAAHDMSPMLNSLEELIRGAIENWWIGYKGRERRRGARRRCVWRERMLGHKCVREWVGKDEGGGVRIVRSTR